MAHMIYKEKFLTYRQPAWHGLGQVIAEEIGAVEAARRIRLPEIVTEPVVTASGLPTDYKAIIGRLDEGSNVYSVVSNNYHEITHSDFIAGWDRNVQQHVETIGLLMTGAGLFLTAKLPTFDVKGEEVEAYIMAENWLTGTRASKIRKTPVRVVCMNTLQMSDAASVFELRIPHNGDAVLHLDKNLQEVMARSTSEYLALKEVYEILASTKVGKDEASKIFKTVYPDKTMPKGLIERASTDSDALDQLAAWERANGAQVEHRDTCWSLFDGAGRGSMSAAAAGTAWGAYNAVAEYEQYVKRSRKSESMMFGMGKDRVAHAFDAACACAGINADE
jgi:phage/plasmid-like protein (TIGR03299 family)